MKIRVIAFATASDLLGQKELDITMPEASKLSDLRDHLFARHPELRRLWPRLAIAIDGELTTSDRPLMDGAEIALLPPVSGGSRDESPPLVDEPIDLSTVEREVASPSCGAVLLFLGTVRDHHAGRSVARLTYSAYRPMAATRLQQICQELEEASSDELRVRIVHRLGDVPIGEPSVVIAAASPHRQAAYEASRTALERLKREVPIWKREHYADGEATWREEEPLVENHSL